MVVPSRSDLTSSSFVQRREHKHRSIINRHRTKYVCPHSAVSYAKRRTNNSLGCQEKPRLFRLLLRLPWKPKWTSPLHHHLKFFPITVINNCREKTSAIVKMSASQDIGQKVKYGMRSYPGAAKRAQDPIPGSESFGGGCQPLPRDDETNDLSDKTSVEGETSIT